MSEPQHNRVREVRIDDEGAGQRIDNFLLKTLKGVPKSRIYRILRKGEVRVNKGRIKQTYKLQSGDLVRIPPIRMAEQGDAVAPGERVLERIRASIIHEDKAYLVLNKPSGLAVHGGSGLSYGAIEGLRAIYPEARFLELAHRLDRDTSGLLLVAKKRSALRHFQQLQQQRGGVDKRYLCLVRGEWRGGRRRIDAPLKKNTLRSGERVVRVAEDGKPSLSVFEPVEHYRGATLMRVELLTGRTHQIRVHAQHSEHPIAGDDKYGDEDFNREMAGRGLKRLFLHAAELRFELPDGGELDLRAPLEPALEQVLDRLELKA